jgi:D-3-phosphoglycerate dehydrogenase
MKKVLYIQPVHADGMNKLAEKYEVIIAPDPSRATVARLIEDVDAVVTRLTVIDQDLMDKGKKLKIIARHGIGVDNIDVDYAAKQNITVITTGNANSISVAEHVIFAMGALVRKVAWLDREMRRGNWASRDTGGASELFGKTIGIIGLGNIGNHLAGIAKSGFGMQVKYYDPFASESIVAKAQDRGYERISDLDELVKQVDALSIHVPLTDETKNLFHSQRLALMKPGAILVNFARGGIVDEEALYEALTDGQLAGAALDVFEQEPPDHNRPLLQLDNVVLSPHCAYFTEDSRVKMSMYLAEGIEAVLSS